MNDEREKKEKKIDRKNNNIWRENNNNYWSESDFAKKPNIAENWLMISSDKKQQWKKQHN